MDYKKLARVADSKKQYRSGDIYNENGINGKVVEVEDKYIKVEYTDEDGEVRTKDIDLTEVEDGCHDQERVEDAIQEIEKDGKFYVVLRPNWGKLGLFETKAGNDRRYHHDLPEVVPSELEITENDWVKVKESLRKYANEYPTFVISSKKENLTEDDIEKYLLKLEPTDFDRVIPGWTDTIYTKFKSEDGKTTIYVGETLI